MEGVRRRKDNINKVVGMEPVKDLLDDRVFQQHSAGCMVMDR